MAIYFTQNTNNVEDIEQMNNVIGKVNKVNTEATSNIGQLTDLNAKAEELSNNIQQALPINSELIKNTESAKVSNTNLLATNQEATTKNTELQASLEKTKEFINGLDGSQNIPQIRMDVTKLQNGLKSNQSLAYTGSSISANDTLEGRTEGMKVKGKTMYKKKDGTYTDTWEEGVTLESFGEAEGNKISILSHGKNLFNFKSIKEEAFDNNSIKLLENGLRIENHWAKSIDFKIDLKPNTKYTSSYNYKVIKDAVNPTDTGGGKLMLHNESTGKYFALTNPKGVGMTFTTPEDIKDYKKIILYSAGGGGSYRGIVEITNIQIEEGTQATQFEAYKEDKKDILIKSPLREWDSMYEDNGQVKVDRYTSVIDFSNLIINVSEVSERPNAQSTNWFQTNFIPQLKNAKKNTLNFNNKYVGVDAETAWKDTNDFECLNVAVQEGGVRIQGRVKKGTTIEQLNEKLRGLIIYYQLATPTVDIVENCVDIDLDTFGEKTYFNILNSLPGTLDFKVPSNIASIVQNTAREVNNIWDVINNLLVPSLIDINKNVAMSTIKNNLK